MRYGQIVGNKRMNECIHRCFEHLVDVDVTKFVKQFKDHHGSEDQTMHTFRELVLGAFLGSNDLKVRHDYDVAGQTPDWCIMNDESRPKCIVELVNFHIDARIQDRIKTQIRDNGIATYFILNDERLYDRIWTKASKYRALAQEHNLAYVVSVFGAFDADVELNDVCKCLFDNEKGLFGLYPMMSGLLFFTTFSGDHHFVYLGNPEATSKIDLPQGVF